MSIACVTNSQIKVYVEWRNLRRTLHDNRKDIFFQHVELAYFVITKQYIIQESVCINVTRYIECIRQ